MTRKVLTVSPGASARDAARLMDRARVHRLIVTEGAGVLGLLSALDLVHAVAEGQLVSAPPGKAGKA
ncbi:CBS domain protein [compost metagenome]